MSRRVPAPNTLFLPACLSVGHRFLLPMVRDATIAEPSGFSKRCAGAPPGHLRQGVTSTHWRLITKDIATPTETYAVMQGSAASGSLMLPPRTCWHEGRPGGGRRCQAGLALGSSRDICRRRRRRRCIRGVALAVGRRLLRDLEPGRLARGCWLCPPGVRQGINEQEAAATLVVGPSVDSARQRWIGVRHFDTKPFVGPCHSDIARSICVEDSVGDHLAGQQLDGLQHLVRHGKTQILGQCNDLAACRRDGLDSSHNRESIRRTFGIATRHDDNLTLGAASENEAFHPARAL